MLHIQRAADIALHANDLFGTKLIDRERSVCRRCEDDCSKQQLINCGNVLLLNWFNINYKIKYIGTSTISVARILVLGTY